MLTHFRSSSSFRNYTLRLMLIALATFAVEAVSAQDDSSTKKKSKPNSGVDLSATVASRIEYSVPMQNEKVRKRVGEMMNETTIDLIQLRRVTKQAHWNVTGKHFHAVHTTTADLAKLLSEHADEVAERALAVGVAVDGRIVRINANSRLNGGPNGFTPDYMMARIMIDRLAQMSKLLRENIAELGQIDLVAQDLLLDVKADVDKYHWQFAVQAQEFGEEEEAD